MHASRWEVLCLRREVNSLTFEPAIQGRVIPGDQILFPNYFTLEKWKYFQEMKPVIQKINKTKNNINWKEITKKLFVVVVLKLGWLVGWLLPLWLLPLYSLCNVCCCCCSLLVQQKEKPTILNLIYFLARTFDAWEVVFCFFHFRQMYIVVTLRSSLYPTYKFQFHRNAFFG